MKLFLLGATGRLGNEILKKALGDEIQTSILVRDAGKVKADSECLSIFEGDPGKVSELDRAMQGCDTIVTTLNISRKSDFPWSKLRAPKTLLSDTMTHLLDLSPKHGVQKIVTVSAWGANESKKDLPFWFRWLIDNSNIKYGYLDHERQEKLLQQSEMDWTIVRPVGLTNSQKDKPAHISTDSKTSSLTVSRKAVAQFIVQHLSGDEYRQKTVTLS